MKTIVIIFAALLLTLAACSKSDKSTYTVAYTIEAVTQHNDTVIINKTVTFSERKNVFDLHQGDLRLIQYYTRVSGESETIMSGVAFFTVIKEDTINIKR